MLINWRDILSMISSPVRFFLFSRGHLLSIFLQQVGGGMLLFLSEAEEVKTIVPRVNTSIKAAKISRLLFFMVVVLKFDESIGQNVTINLNFILVWSVDELMTGRIRVMKCSKTGMIVPRSSAGVASSIYICHK